MPFATRLRRQSAPTGGSWSLQRLGRPRDGAGRGRHEPPPCPGVANHFNLDPTLVRVLWVATILLGGFGVIVYVIM